MRAIGETHENYFLAYTEHMKKKSPKKIVLRWWMTAAAVIVAVGIVFVLPPVRKALFPKTG